jgi:integral membrane protein (TIGR01906 family)
LKKAAGRPRWVTVCMMILAALAPVVLVLGSVRLLLSEPFLRLEYSIPGFPPDRYGFTKEDRLHWAPLALEYLLNNEGLDFLADLRFESGQAVFTQRELRHMEDVKKLTHAALLVLYCSLAVAVVVGCILGLKGRAAALWEALRRGALATLYGMATLAIALAIGFSFVFVGFHRIFFTGDTWLFLYSDTLIRLFPEQFWRNAFIAIVVLTVLGAVLLGIVARALLRHAHDAEARGKLERNAGGGEV